jgi:hypothetical protein
MNMPERAGLFPAASASRPRGERTTRRYPVGPYEATTTGLTVSFSRWSRWSVRARPRRSGRCSGSRGHRYTAPASALGPETIAIVNRARRQEHRDRGLRSEAVDGMKLQLRRLSVPADPGQDAGELERASVGDQHITERREGDLSTHDSAFPESTPPRDDAASFASRGTFCAHVPEGGRAGHGPPSSSYTRCASRPAPFGVEALLEGREHNGADDQASMVKPVQLDNPHVFGDRFDSVRVQQAQGGEATCAASRSRRGCATDAGR